VEVLSTTETLHNDERWIKNDVQQPYSEVQEDTLRKSKRSDATTSSSNSHGDEEIESTRTPDCPVNPIPSKNYNVVGVHDIYTGGYQSAEDFLVGRLTELFNSKEDFVIIT
jgi:hypothetical protein